MCCNDPFDKMIRDPASLKAGVGAAIVAAACASRKDWAVAATGPRLWSPDSLEPAEKFIAAYDEVAAVLSAGRCLTEEVHQAVLTSMVSIKATDGRCTAKRW